MAVCKKARIKYANMKFMTNVRIIFYTDIEWQQCVGIVYTIRCIYALHNMRQSSKKYGLHACAWKIGVEGAHLSIPSSYLIDDVEGAFIEIRSCCCNGKLTID